MRLITTLTFLLTSVYCFSQNPFKPGYIVNNNGDTTRGYLKPGIEDELQTGVSFSENSGDETGSTLTISNIKGFGFDGDNAYEKVTYRNPANNMDTTHFAKLLLGGYYRLLSFYNQDNLNFVIESKDTTCLMYDVNYTGTGVIKQAGNYKNLMWYLSRNCGDFKTRIENTTYDKVDIIRFFESVNRCKSANENVNLYYKREKSKFNFYVYGGGMIVSNGHEFTGKAIARYVIGGLNDKTSLNIGFNFMQHFKTDYIDVFYQGNKRKEEITINMYSIPITGQYIFTRGVIQPYLDAGFSLVYKKGTGAFDYGNRPITDDEKKGIGITVAIGVDINILKNLMVQGEWRYEVLTHYPTLGLAYRFGK